MAELRNGSYITRPIHGPDDQFKIVYVKDGWVFVEGDGKHSFSLKSFFEENTIVPDITIEQFKAIINSLNRCPYTSDLLAIWTTSFRGRELTVALGSMLHGNPEISLCNITKYGSDVLGLLIPEEGRR